MIADFLEKIAIKLGMAERGKHLASGAIGLFSLRLFSMLSVFATGIFLSRTIGAAGYGEYVYVLAWVQVLVIPAMLGFDRLVVKEIAGFNSTKKWGLFRGLLRRSQQGVMLVGVILAVLTAITFTLIQPVFDSIDVNYIRPFQVGMILIPLFAYLRTRQSLLIGLDKVAIAHFSEMVLVPVFHLGITATVIFFLQKSISSTQVIHYHIIAMVIAIVFVWIQSRRYIPKQVFSSTPEFDTRNWLVGGLFMLLVSSVQILNSRIDVIMVGSMLGSVDAGIYNAANRGSTIILYTFLAVNTALSPLIASYHVEGRWDKMQSIAKKASRVSLVAAVVPTILLILFGKWFLLLFGPEFVAGLYPLILMCIAEFVVISFGALIVLLIMTGHTREAFFGTSLSTLLNIIINFLLIPKYGMMGAAMALTVGHLMSAILMSYFVRKKLRISPEAWSKSIVK